MPDDQASMIGARMGMSVSFPRRLVGPDDNESDSRLWVDPGHYNRHELLAAVLRLNRAGFTQSSCWFIVSTRPGSEW